MKITEENKEELFIEFCDMEANEEMCISKDAFKEAITKALTLYGVGNWVAIESTEQPEKCTDVMVMYKDGRKAVALFDGDGRFYIEKDDWDITNIIVKWHRLP
jgi:hypothetical protein